jgi:hypothetical protein
MRKINEQLNAIAEQCSAVPSIPLRDWNPMLFFGTIEQPGVAGLRYNNFLSQARNAEIITVLEHGTKPHLLASP